MRYFDWPFKQVICCFANAGKAKLRLAIFPLVSLSLLTSSVAMAEHDENTKQSNIVQPSENFLEFLAAMSEVDGTISDPLDMLEIAETDLKSDLNTELTKQNSSAKFIPVSEIKQAEKEQ